MRRKKSAAGDGPATEADDYHVASQGLVVQLVNKVLFRFGSQSLIRRLLNGRSLGTDMPGRLLTSAAHHQSRKNSKRASTLSTSALLASTPSMGESPSLLSGFTAFMDHEHSTQNDERSIGRAHEEAVAAMELSPEAFEAMVRDTPGDLVASVLSARKDEYSEHLRELERVRREMVRKLADLDDRILQAVSERKDIEQRLQETQGAQDVALSSERSSSQTPSVQVPKVSVTVEDVTDEEDDADVEAAQMYEQGDARRLRKLACVYRGHYGGITALGSDATLGLIASGSLDTQVRVWDMETGACQHVISGHHDIVRQVQFHERFLLTASNDSRIRMWDLSLLDSVQPQASTMEMRETLVSSFSRDEEHSDGSNEWGEEPQKVETLQSTTPLMTPTIYRRMPPLELCCENTFVGHTDAVTCFQAMADTMISGSADKTVREWDLASGTVRQTIDITWATRDAQARRVDTAGSTTGRRHGSWGSRTVQQQSQSRQPLPFDNVMDPGGGVRGTDSGDGGFIGALQFYEFALATGSADGCLRLWDLRTAQAHRQMFGHTQAVTSLHFDERSVATGSLDGTAVLWDLRMGRMLQKLVYADAVSSVQLVRGTHTAFAAECWIAARDTQMHHYMANSMQQLGYASDYGVLNTMRSREDLAASSSGRAAVTRLRCMDGEMLLSGDAEGIVKLWNI
ncbi:Mitochondrial fission protein [Coemansia erecta]|nr:Mitochondrial fission protein [Coemansia erecta]